MAITSAAEKLAGQAIAKKDEKVEKRRALGRGLESLLPGPRVVVPGSESRATGAERGGSEAGAASSGGGGEQQVPHFVRNDNSVEARNDNTSGGSALEEIEARRTGVVASHEHSPHEASTPLAAGQPGAAVPSFEQNEVISIEAQAETRITRDVVTSIPLEVIDKNPYQTRYVFDEDMLVELRESIREHGVVQPVVVRPAEVAGRFTLVLGERRLRASKMAGKETIPALVRMLSPQQAAEMTVLENVVREDLNPLEQAEAFRVLSKEFHLTQAQIAERIGVSRETVSNYMRLLRLPKKVMDYMLSERISFSDAREILRLENDDYIEQVADEVVEHKLKWDQIEDRVMRINGSFPMLPGQTLPGEKKKSGGARWMDPNVRAAQTDMERTLGMRVRIRDRHGKGKIVIEYASVDDYERVTSMLRGKQ
jgi:ParB family chromosome partitioning protein